MDGHVKCPACGAVRIRGLSGWAVCPNGHGRLVPNWSRDDLPTAVPGVMARVGRGRRQRTYCFGPASASRVYVAVPGATLNWVEGRSFSGGRVLACIAYSKSGRRRIKLLEPLDDVLEREKAEGAGKAI